MAAKLEVTLEEVTVEEAAGPTFLPQSKQVAEAVVSGKAIKVGGNAKDRDKVIREVRTLVSASGRKLNARSDKNGAFILRLKPSKSAS